MLTEQRQEEILKLLDQKGSVTLQELKEYFRTSESTIRRDLNALDKKGALTKVFGGAVKQEGRIMLREEQVSQRKTLYREEKNRIGRYAASLIEPEDFVYLDAKSCLRNSGLFTLQYAMFFGCPARDEKNGLNQSIITAVRLLYHIAPQKSNICLEALFRQD